jgi:small subunit ribosomal protein S7
MEQKKNKELILNNIDSFLQTDLGKKIVNRLMKDGKKVKAEKILSDVIILLSKIQPEDPIKILKEAIQRVQPLVEVRTIRVRGANYQVPVPVPVKRKTSLSIKWIIESARKKKTGPMKVRLQEEFLLAYQRQGESIKKKIAVHKLASANRAYTHFRWF